VELVSDIEGLKLGGALIIASTHRNQDPARETNASGIC